jgi:ABC-type sugar transport system ATPase subunit
VVAKEVAVDAINPRGTAAATNPTDDILVFKGISKSFPGVQALDKVSFSIKRGEIHTVAGENGAGKSTLMKILSGWYPPSEGEVIFKGAPVKITDPQAALSLGMATVYQELMLCENLSVVENIYLGRELRTGGGVDWRQMHRRASELLCSFNVSIDTRALVKNLPIAQRQIVEIAKAVNMNTEVLILDEPTSSLTVKETRILFENLRAFKQKGMTIIFISHRLEEVFEVTDRISVLRDGRYLGTYVASETTPKAIVSLIAGKELLKEISAAESRECVKPEVVLEVRGLSRGRYFRDVSFSLHKGELLGFYGLQGAGRTELMQTIFAMYRNDTGEILLDGAPTKVGNPREAIQAGFAFIPEDRRRQGLFSSMDVKDNVAVIHGKKISLFTFVQVRKMAAIAREYVDRLSIKVTGLSQRVKNLSGGNQQKVIIGRSLSTLPRILIMDEPTRGIDVGAKAEIYKILRGLKNDEHKAIIMVSSELEEVVAECDRVIVMYQGRISGEASGAGITKERILHLAFGGADQKAGQNATEYRGRAAASAADERSACT